ncbi:MAG: class I SAM-dependent methyltransferase [Planctomycetes bacterium]|nr:class I SAM-dependent methyltransferase [Planctomycetota bacterium]
MQPHPFYDRALLYDAAFSWDPAPEADFVAWGLRGGLPGAVRVLEPFCGAGRLLAAMEQRGFRAEGFDRNPAMLEVARRRAPRSRVVQADAAVWEAEAPYEGAYALIDSFRHLGMDAAATFLGALGRGLVPGAGFVLGLDLAEEDGVDGIPLASEERWTSSRDGLVVECVYRSTGPAGKRREWAEARLRVISGAPREEVVDHYVLTTWTWAQIEAALAAAGFRVRGVYDRRYDRDRPLTNRVGGVVVVAYSKR